MPHDDTRPTTRTPAAMYALRGLLLATTFAGGVLLAAAGVYGASCGVMLLAAAQAWWLVSDVCDDGDKE